MGMSFFKRELLPSDLRMLDDRKGSQDQSGLVGRALRTEARVADRKYVGFHD